MRTKRNLIFLVMAGLLAALVTSAFATSNVYSSTPNLVGTWRVTVEVEGVPEGFETLHTYFGDGNFVEATNIPTAMTTTSHGVWMGSGNTYVVTFEAFEFDEQGQYSRKVKVRSSIQLDDAEHLTAEWVMSTIDPEGKVTEAVAAGTFEGTRMEVELP
jgi:hypothetical protein